MDDDFARFRFLEKAEYNDTIDIFKSLFPGAENELFFDEQFKDNIFDTRIAVIESDHTIISITQIRNIKVITTDGIKVQPYLFAVGTLPEYRRRGFRDMLINNVCSVLEQEGYEWAFLAPVNKDIWSGIGFNICFPLSDEDASVIDADEGIDICLVRELKKNSFIQPIKLQLL